MRECRDRSGRRGRLPALLGAFCLIVILMPGQARADGGGDTLERFHNQNNARRAKPVKRAAPRRKIKRRAAPRRRPVRIKQNIKPKPAPGARQIKPLDIKWWLKPLDERYVPGEVLLTLKPDAAAGEIERIARQNNLRLLAAEQNTLLEATVYFLDYKQDKPVRDMVESLMKDAAVASVQPNYLYATQQDAGGGGDAGSGGDTSGGGKARKNYNLQYALKSLGVADAHDVLQGKDIVVAVIDTQMDLEHPELDGAISAAFNAVSRNSSEISHDHGTAIGSIIAARHQLTGVAPRATIVTVNAFETVSRFAPALSTTRALLEAVEWSFSKKARIFNLSFAGPKDPLFLRALERLDRDGAILIASAGNEGERSPAMYPAAADMVIAVTAVNQKDDLFIAASRGDYVEMASPGVDILVALPGRRYGFMSGTSMAAAHVSGIAALILEHNPDIPAANLRKILRVTAEDLGSRGRDKLYGVGRANAFAAIKAIRK